MRTLNLNIKERLGVGTLLERTYEKGGLDLKSLGIAQKMIMGLLIDDDEKKKVGWTQTPSGNVTWDLKKDPGKNIDFSDDAIKLITDIIKRRSDSKELTLQDTFIVELADKLDIKV